MSQPSNEPSTPLDVETIRAETPGIDGPLHLNSCGSSLPPGSVVETMIDYLRYEARVGGYEAATERDAQLERVYHAGAQMLGCRAEELAFMSGASEGWWRAFLSIPLGPGDRILTGRSEYVSNIYAMIQVRRRGVEVEIVPDDADGMIDLEQLEAMLDERVKLVALTLVPMTNGMVNPGAEVGRLAKTVGARYLIDACQAAGQMALDVDDLGCDFMSFTGRKFMRGPRGTGLLYVRGETMPGLDDPVIIDGRSATWVGDDAYALDETARRFELFEIPFAAKAGFGVAIDYALDLGLDRIEDRVTALADRFRAGLDATDGVRVLDTGTRRCGIVSFDVAGVDCATAATRLRNANIVLGAPPLEASRLDLAGRGVESVVRAGVHYFNTEAEIDRTLDEVASLIA